jgi:hypothetical protein
LRASSSSYERTLRELNPESSSLALPRRSGARERRAGLQNSGRFENCEALVRINNDYISNFNTLARPGGFEPPTHSLEGCCSIQLS